MYNFTGFTEKANMALNKSVTVAEDLGHTYIGSEHVLLGLLDSTDSVAGKLLSIKGVTYRKIYEMIKSGVGVGLPTELEPTDFTPRSKHIIEGAIILSNSMKQSLAGTEHILLSMCREGNGYACDLLNRVGVSPQSIIKELTNSVGNNKPSSRQTSPQNDDKTIVSKFSRDLTALAKENKIDPVIGRENEIQRVIQILSRRTKNNPVLIGEPGVGKTAIAEGLAVRIVEKRVPPKLYNKEVYLLDFTAIVAGTQFRGQFEARLKGIVEETKKLVQGVGNVVREWNKLHPESAKRFSVKLRLGDDDFTDEKFFSFTDMLVEEGVQLLTLHPRTKKEKLSRPPRYHYAEDLKQRYGERIQVYVNGNIKDKNSFDAACKICPSVDGVMISRASVSKPWIFYELKKSLCSEGQTSEQTAPLEIDMEKLALDYIDDIQLYQPQEFWKTRLQRFFTYFSENFKFGHYAQSQWINADFSSENNEDLRARIREFFEKCPEERVKVL